MELEKKLHQLASVLHEQWALSVRKGQSIFGKEKKINEQLSVTKEREKILSNIIFYAVSISMEDKAEDSLRKRKLAKSRRGKNWLGLEFN